MEITINHDSEYISKFNSEYIANNLIGNIERGITSQSEFKLFKTTECYYILYNAHSDFKFLRMAASANIKKDIIVYTNSNYVITYITDYIHEINKVKDVPIKINMGQYV